MIESLLVNTFNLSGSAASLSKLRSTIYSRQILFFHVPKCGGTSLSHFFRLRYLASSFRLREETASRVTSPHANRGDDWMQFKQDLFLYHALSGTSFVQGHVMYAPEVFADLHERASFITLLREPTARVISHYLFDRRLYEMPFGEFLDSPRGESETSLYCRFFGGLKFSEGPAREAHRDAAISALSRFDVVGLLEQPEALRRQLRERLGVHVRIPHRNIGRGRTLGSVESEIARHRERLEAMCRLDGEIYRHAQEQLLPRTSS
jgi:hypothetical protein